MQRTIIKRVILVFSVALMFSACEYSYITPEVIIEKMDFQTDILPIFNEQGCSASACHMPLGSIAPDFSPEKVYESLLAYIDTINPESSALLTALNDNGYHQGRTSPAQRADILQWIEEGANAIVLIEPKSFALDLVPIFENQGCAAAGCHKPGGGLAPDFSPANVYESVLSYVDTDFPEQSIFYTTLNNASGTHVGRSTSAEQEIILQWISEGALNN